MYWWETSLTPVAVGLQSNGPYWTVRTAHKRCKQSDDKFPGSHQNIIHGTFSFREGSTLKDVVPDTTRQLQSRGVSKPWRIRAKSDPRWGLHGLDRVQLKAGPTLTCWWSRCHHRENVDPEQNFITRLVGPFIYSFWKKTFNDPDVGGPFTKRKQSAARV